jgi:uncharacterized Zn finger protein
VTGRAAAPSPRSRRAFGATWWGRAWTEALEGRARLDPNRLPRGRTYARSGAVGSLAVAPGRVDADVQGSRRRPYSVVLRVREFDEGEWERLLDVLAGRLGHTAALLDGELPPDVAGDAAGAGLDLLPGPGELGPRCSCPDYADPCKHAAAVCYLVADRLDADPFDLLLLRGREREEVLAGLRARRRRPDVAAPAEASPLPVEEGVDAREAFARPAETLPPPPLPPPRPGRPAVLPVDPPAGSGVRRDDLVALAADAASRAFDLAAGAGDRALGLDREADLARLAAARLGTPGLALLAARARVPGPELTRLALAWGHGGAAGVSVQRSAWTPMPEQLAEGRTALASLGPVRTWRNRLTVTGAGVQLRLGQSDRLWWRLRRNGTEWDVDAGPAADPGDLLAGID